MSILFNLIRERKINTTEAIILQYYCLNSDYSEPNNVIADDLNVSLSVVSRAKRKLIALGLIEIQKNFTSGLARDADTISTSYNVIELFGIADLKLNQQQGVKEEEIIIQNLIEKHLRRSSSPVTVSNIATQIAKLNGKIKPKTVEKHDVLIMNEVEKMGYHWVNNGVFATLL